jgi:hypothetical protein
VLVKGLGANRLEEIVEGAMALAGGYAIMPSDGKRAVGSPHGPANETNDALVALHGFIKKTRTTADEDLGLVQREAAIVGRGVTIELV